MKRVIGIDASRAAKQSKTGTEWYAFYVIQELKQIIPNTVEVRLYSPKPLTGELAKLPDNWKNVVLPWRGYFWTMLRLGLEMMIHPPEILWLPCSGLPLWLPPKTINTIHDIGFDRFPEAYKKRVIWYHRFAVRRALKKCSQIITVSNFSKTELRELYGANSEKISVTHLGYNKNLFKHYAQDEIAEVLHKYKIDSPYIIYVGRIEKKKNIVRIIEVFKKVKFEFENLQLVMLGPTGDAEKVVKNVEGVQRLDWVETIDMAKILAGAKVFVFPTLYEGFGIPILESFASGVPVLTSKGGAHEEVSGEAAVLVYPEKVEDIYMGLRKILSNEELRQKLISLGQERVKGFSWKNTATETWKVFDKILHNG